MQKGKKKMYVISWTKPTRHTGRFLYAPEGVTPLLVHHREKATPLTRDEVNAVILALWNTPGGWDWAGAGSYPEINEVR
jgi:hypothetical protein